MDSIAFHKSTKTWLFPQALVLGYQHGSSSMVEVSTGPVFIEIQYSFNYFVLMKFSVLFVHRLQFLGKLDSHIN